jgi:hypothetical protein
MKNPPTVLAVAAALLVPLGHASQSDPNAPDGVMGQK